MEIVFDNIIFRRFSDDDYVYVFENSYNGEYYAVCKKEDEKRKNKINPRLYDYIVEEGFVKDVIARNNLRKRRGSLILR